MSEQVATKWSDYYRALEGRQPRPLFLAALARFNPQHILSAMPLAIDLGCGDGAESVALLQSGWRVLALDQEATAIESVRARVASEQQARLATTICSFEELSLPPAAFIYAGFSLPFCAPAHFAHLWTTIVGSLLPAGRFAGHFFGVRDSWASHRTMTFHTAEEVQGLFADSFTLEFFQEVEEDGKAFSGPKHWHLFEVIARKAAQEKDNGRTTFRHPQQRIYTGRQYSA
jgi:tellurite methyltransferase